MLSVHCSAVVVTVVSGHAMALTLVPAAENCSAYTVASVPKPDPVIVLGRGAGNAWCACARAHLQTCVCLCQVVLAVEWGTNLTTFLVCGMWWTNNWIRAGTEAAPHAGMLEMVSGANRVPCLQESGAHTDTDGAPLGRVSPPRQPAAEQPNSPVTATLGWAIVSARAPEVPVGLVMYSWYAP